MNVLGVRCSTTDYAFCVLTGDKASPMVVVTDAEKFPKGFTEAQNLKWLVQEFEGHISKYQVNTVVIKRFEGRNRGNAFENRVEHEAAIMLAGANLGITNITKKVKSTISKHLGLKGQARYLKTKLDTTVITNYDNYPEKTQEAILAAWSELD